MKVNNVEKLEKNQVALTIEIGAEEFEAAVEAAYRRKVRSMNIPGFRKGKAPRRIVEKMYGEGVFYEDAVNATYPAAYNEAIKAEDIDPVEQADIEVKEISAEGYTFIARVHVYPEVKIGQYKGIEAYKPEVTVPEESVDAEIERLRQRNARIETVEREAKLGDVVVLDYEGFESGVAFDGGKGEKQNLELGSGQFIPGFEEKLVGYKAGDSADIEVTFPEQYHSEALAGKPAVFKCLIHEVREKSLPEADDEFAKDVSEFDTIEEYKASIRERIKHSREHESEHTFEDGIIDKILESFEADIPDAMIDSQLENIMQDFNYRLSSQGLDINTYMQITGMSPRELQEQYRPLAERQVKSGLIFDKVAELEGFQISEDELETEYNRLAGVYNRTVDEVKKAISEKSLKHDLLALKASTFLTESAVAISTPPVKDEDVKEEKPKKTRKKAAKSENDKNEADDD